MKKILTILLSVVMAAAFLTGCQATPEKEIVIQKDMEQMIEKAGATDSAKTPGISLLEQTGAPETLVMETTEGNFTLSVDADVIVPDADSMPIIRVKAGEFTQEQVTAYWNALVGDAVLWERKTELTKSEIEGILVSLRRALAENEDDADYVERIQDQIDYYERIYPSAPENIENTQADSTLKRLEETDATGNMRGWYMGAGGSNDNMSFFIKNPMRNNSGDILSPATMSFGTPDSSHNYGQVNTIVVDENTEIDESLKQYIKITPAQAKALVEDFLRETNTPIAVYAMTLENDEETGIYDGVIAPAEHYAYRINCIRMIEGALPCARIKGATEVWTDEPADTQMENAYGIVSDYGCMKRWEYETMSFMVSDKGIISMDWRAPVELLETKVSDCALMPFAEMQSVFEKMMFIEYEAQAEHLDNLTCRIDEVCLEMIRIVEQDSIENGLLVPVWNFYGVDLRTDKGETTETSTNIVLCVNAIDGSIIDTGKGY